MKPTQPTNNSLECVEASSALLLLNMMTDLTREINTLKNIIELSPGNVYWKNIDGSFLGCNKNMIRVAGVNSLNDIIGKNTVQLFGEKIGIPVMQLDKKVIKENREYTFEETGVSDKNDPAIYLSKKLPLYDTNGKIMGVMGISFDITDRKRMERELKEAKEKAETANRVKSQFVAAVNHELRTPLASIIGLLELLKRENLSETDSKKLTASIENCAQYLLTLVNDVLDFSKIETGAYTLQLTCINLRNLLTDIGDLLFPLVENSHLKLNFIIDPAVPPYLSCDARVLQHILINLINNAIKYTKEGGVTVEVKLLKQIDSTAHLKFSITDTGIGIPEDKRELIFQPFQQLQNTQARGSSRNGAGLGLTIVKKLAAIMGTKLEVESQINIGSTFSFNMALTIPDDEIIAAYNKFIPATQKNTADKITVLVVEDDTIIQYIHRKHLLNLGCLVDVVASSGEAMQALSEEHSIILLDMTLPDMRGTDLIKMIRETTSYTCPIVVISAFMQPEEERACIEAGAMEVINKPVSQGQLKDLLVRYCNYSGKI